MGKCRKNPNIPPAQRMCSVALGRCYHHSPTPRSASPSNAGGSEDTSTGPCSSCSSHSLGHLAVPALQYLFLQPLDVGCSPGVPRCPGTNSPQPL